MTLNELRVIAADAQVKSLTLKHAADDLHSFMNFINRTIAASNILSSAINADSVVSIYAPLYTAKLAAIETAADALATDN